MAKARYNPQGDVGVSGVALLVGKHLRWILRPQPTADVGIDAEIEVVQDGRALGQLVKAQIKAGPSWLKRQTSQGFIYTGSNDHFSYWLDHCLPVIVVLYDPDNHRAYWELVTRESAKKTGKRWKLEVPFTQLLDASAASRLKDIASQAHRRRAATLAIGERLMSTGIDVQSRQAGQIVLDAIRSANNVVYISTPFLGHRVVRILEDLAQRIRIRVLVGEPHLDGKPEDHVSRNPNLEVRLVRSGKENYRSRFHLRAIVIDDSICVMGSFNLTSYSFLSDDTCVTISDQRAVSHILKIYWDKWNDAVPITDLRDLHPNPHLPSNAPKRVQTVRQNVSAKQGARRRKQSRGSPSRRRAT